MAFEIIRNDITKMDVDAIVNTANPCPIVGAGTDTAVHTAAGPKLLEARKKIGDIPRGESAITPGFDLKAKYVIHTVGLYWEGGQQGEEKVLRRCYDSALELARKNGCRSIAFPLLATGCYGFPMDRALSVAVQACSEFLLNHRMKIYLVVFHPEAFALSRSLVSEVRSYIDRNYVDRARIREYGAGLMAQESCRRLRPMELDSAAETEETLDELKEKLARRLKQQHETFTESMLRIMMEQGWEDPEVYGRIFMDRKTFNKIKNNPSHHPQKKTAIQLANALRLNYDQARDLIGKAGYAFTDTSKTDLIFSYCFEHGIYDPDVIDALLVDNGEKACFTLE